MNVQEEKKMQELLKWSLENHKPHQLELCFFLVENGQLVFLERKEFS